MADDTTPGETPKRAARAPGRRPLTEGDAENTRRSIRRQAVRLFNEHGYASVSVDDIAQAAELTRATLYYHYRSKADIFVESVTEMLGYVHEAAMQIFDQRNLTVVERLNGFVSGRRESRLPKYEAVMGPELSEAMLWETMAHLAPRQRVKVTQKIETLHEATRALLAEGVENGELRPIPVAVLDYMFWQIFDPEKYPKEAGITQEQWDNHLTDAFLRGVATSR